MKLCTSSTVHLRMSSTEEMSSPFRIRPWAPLRRKHRSYLAEFCWQIRILMIVIMRIFTPFTTQCIKSRVQPLADTGVLDTKSPGNEQNLVLKGFFMWLLLFTAGTVPTSHYTCKSCCRTSSNECIIQCFFFFGLYCYFNLTNVSAEQIQAFASPGAHCELEHREMLWAEETG